VRESEQAVVAETARVVEEVVVGKTASERTEQFSDTLHSQMSTAPADSSAERAASACNSVELDLHHRAAARPPHR
jgi:ABC-type branched-subunit amino acid transport system ATPase component